jgi:hypothetical protein
MGSVLRYHHTVSGLSRWGCHVMKLSTVLFLLILPSLSACGDKPEDTGPVPEGDSDTDSDADGDTDADSDADADADSDADADADADSDADTDPTEEIDCDDGLDGDFDGLIDCEDGDCSDDEICGELLCEDGLDGDLDGLIDCDDDDCWGTVCHPGGVRATVHGGHLRAARYQTSTGNWSHATLTGTHMRLETIDIVFEHRAWMSGVSGTVRVLPSGYSAWSTATPTTCAWSFASGSLTQRLDAFAWTQGVGYSDGFGIQSIPYGLYTTAVSLYPATRRSFTITDGCRVGGSWFLPERFTLADRGDAWRIEGTASYYGHSIEVQLGQLWYAGTPSGTSTSYYANFGSAVPWTRRRAEHHEVELAAPLDARALDTLPEIEVGTVEISEASPDGTDLDADGMVDLITGNLASVYLFAGPVSGTVAASDATATISFTSLSSPSILGVGGTEDVDGDGIQDLAALVRSRTANEAYVYLFLGTDDGSWTGTLDDTAAWASYSVAMAGTEELSFIANGDTDGDGLADLVTEHEGTVSVMTALSSGTHEIDTSYAARITMDDRGPISLGDLNGDGLADLVVGAPFSGSGSDGGASIYLGPVSGEVEQADGDILIDGDSGSRAGRHISAAGDVDGDGLKDVLIGAQGATGQAFLFSDLSSAAMDLTDATASIVAADGSAPEWISVGIVGDLDGDGHADMVFGEAGLDYATHQLWDGINSTKGYLLLGPVSGSVSLEDAERRWLTNRFLGWLSPGTYDTLFTALGDLDGDGDGDLAITSPCDRIWFADF